MLKFIRKNKSGAIGMVIVGFCALLMAGFGVDMFYGSGARGPVATVNDVEISHNEFFRNHQRLVARYRQQFGDMYDQIAGQIDTRQQALDFLITDYLLRSLERELGLTASTRQIEEYIAQSPFFGGEVTPEGFRSYLRAVGMTSVQLEESMRRELARNQLRSMLRDLSPLSEKELRAIWEQQETSYKLYYLTVKADSFTEKVDVSNEATLEAYFFENQEAYRVPRKVKIDFVEFKPVDYEDSFPLTEEDLRLAFEDSAEEYFEPAKVRLRQIFFKKEAHKEDSIPIPELSSELSDEDEFAGSEVDPLELKKEIAEQVLERLATGEEFTKLVSEFSEDHTTKDKGGDMGLLPYESLQPKLRDAARGLDIGDHSGTIETEQGLHILYLDEEVPRKQKSFREVKDEVEKRLRKADAPVYTYAEAEQFYDKWQSEGILLKDYAPKTEKPLKSTEQLVSTSDPLPSGIPRELVTRLNGRAEGDQDIIELDDTIFVVEVSSVKDSYLPEFEEAKAKVIEDYKQVKSGELAQSYAENLLNEIRPETSADALAFSSTVDFKNLGEREEVSLGETPLTKLGQASDKLFSIPGVKESARALTSEHAVANDVFQFGREYYLIALAEKKAPAAEDFESAKETLRDSEQSAREARLMDTLVSYLKAQAEIEISDDFTNDII